MKTAPAYPAENATCEVINSTTDELSRNPCAVRRTFLLALLLALNLFEVDDELLRRVSSVGQDLGSVTTKGKGHKRRERRRSDPISRRRPERPLDDR